MSFRTGVVIVGGQPAFQASIEAGFSTNGKRQSVSATYEGGAASGARTQGFVALNVDHHVKDRDANPIGRVGLRARGVISDDPDGSASALEVRGAAFTGLGRDRKTGSGGLGVEIAGGIALDPRAPILEANLILHGRWNVMN